MRKCVSLWISTCQLPDPNTDPELFKIVTEVQTHSDTKSCKKGNKHCRFGFPKQPVENTFITRPMPEEIRDLKMDQTMVVVTHWRLETSNRMQTLKACFTEINQSATMDKQGRVHRTGEHSTSC